MCNLDGDSGVGHIHLLAAYYLAGFVVFFPIYLVPWFLSFLDAYFSRFSYGIIMAFFHNGGCGFRCL